LQFPEDATIVYTKLGEDLYFGNATLTNLSQGYHNVTLGLEANLYMNSNRVQAAYFFTTVSFSVDSIPPNVSILSPQNKSYTTANIPIEFTANKSLSSISYSLDGAENITVEGNFTLHNLPDGYHNITVYATDEAGNVGSQTVTFTVEKPQTGIFVSIVIIAVIAVPVAIVCLIAGLSIYRRHRKTANLKQIDPFPTVSVYPTLFLNLLIDVPR
jgi:hypothetical protein